jgi:PKD repeat protein
MRKLILLLTFISLAYVGVGQLFITELADPENESGARYVEIYNAGASSVDLSTGYDLQRWTNGDTDPQAPVELTGTIAAGDFYVVCANGSTFNSTYGFDADEDIGGGGPADSNGDDQIALRDPSDNIIDMFGVVGEDGSGTNHEFEDGRAERKATVTTGNTTYTFSEWNIWNDTGDEGTTNDPQQAPGDFDPGAWIGAASGPVISISETSLTGFSYDEGNGPSAEQTFTVEGTDLTDDISIAATADFEISETSGSGFGSTVTLTQNGGAVDESTIYVRLSAGLVIGNYSGDIELTSTDATTLSVSLSGSVNDPNASFEDFANFPETGSSYQDGTFTGQDGSTWTYVDCRGDQEITDETPALRNNSSAVIYSGTINGGVGTISFDYMQAFSTDVNLDILINDNIVATVTSNGQAQEVLNSGEITVNVTGDFELKFQQNESTGGQVAVDNVQWTSYSGGGNTPPSISNITQTPEEVTSSDAVSVSAEITDSEGTVDAAELHWGTTSGSLTNTIAMSNTTGDTYATDSDIPAQADETTVYYEVYAQDDEGAESISSEMSYTVNDPTPSTLPYYQTFDSWPDGWYAFSVVGDQQWEQDSFSGDNFAKMNGYDDGAVDNEDWLISPAFNLDNYEDELLNFESAFNFSGPALEFYYSTDYDGVSDPSVNGTWVDLTSQANWSDGGYNWVNSGNIDISGITGTSVYFAFKYTSNPSDGSSTWQVDDISIEEVTNLAPEITNIIYTPETVTSSDAVSVTADITDSDGTIQTAELHWGTTSGDLTNTIGMSNTTGDTYATDSDIPAQADGTTVYFEIYAEDDGGAETTSSEQNYTVTDPAFAALPYEQTFESDLDDMYPYSVVGDQTWYWDEYGGDQYARISGYSSGSDYDNEDWLITPEFDFSGDINTVLNFDEAINFGTDNIDNEQEVYISTNYAGIGDPNAADWTKLTVTGRASGDNWDFVSVDEVDLSAYDGETSVHIAFKYTSTTSGSATWQVDNISVEQLGEDGQITVTSPNGGESWEQGTSHDITWTSANLTGDVKIELQGDDTEVLAETTEDDGAFTWDIPADQTIGDNYLITITSVDVETVSDSSDEPFSVTAPYVPGDLVITEIMYNPPESGNDSLEYVEIYNLGDFDVNLEGYYLEGVTFTFPDVTLAADDYMVIAINQDAFESFFGVTALEWSSGALSNGGETITLYDVEGTVIDEVPYGDGEPWPEAADGEGPSLTLCDPSLDNSLGENWSASDEYVGMNNEDAKVFGTPGAPCGTLNMEPDFEALNTELGAGDAATFIDLTTGSPDYWEWTFEGATPETSNTQNPDNIVYNEAGTFDVTLVVYNETGTTSITKEDYITVNAAPVADFSANVTTTAVGGEVIFTDESTGNPTSWVWTFEGGDPATYSGQNPPAVTYNEAGTYDVTLTVTNEYGESTEVKSDYITVTFEPAANFEADETTLLVGESTTFTDLSSGDPETWEWTFEGGDPATYSGQNPPAVAYNEAGTYDVTLTVSNEIGTNSLTREDYINVGLEPVADFESSAQNIVEGTTVQFTDLSENNPVSWSWSFNGGTPATSEEQNPEVTYHEFGVYSVILEASNVFGSDTEAKVDYIAVDADGIEQLSLDEEKMIVYPNPAVDMVNVALRSGLQGTLIIRTATGNKVMEKTILNENTEFNVKNLPQGIYFVEFIDEESHQRITKRLIVK